MLKHDVEYLLRNHKTSMNKMLTALWFLFKNPPRGLVLVPPATRGDFFWKTKMATIDLLTPDFWDSCRHNKTLLCDSQSQKLAIYANGTGQIVIAGFDSGDAIVTDIEIGKTLPMVRLLLKAMLDAEPIAEKCHQEYIAYQKILDAESLLASRARSVDIQAIK